MAVHCNYNITAKAAKRGEEWEAYHDPWLVKMYFLMCETKAK